MKSDESMLQDPDLQLTYYEQNTGSMIWFTHDNVSTTCKTCVHAANSAFTVLRQARGQDKLCLRCAAARNRARVWENPQACGNMALLITKTVTDFRNTRADLLNCLASQIATHPVYWVIFTVAATRGDADKYVSHFGCVLHPAREAEGAAKNGRLCHYVILKRWKSGERGRTFEYALTSDPGNSAS